jgi:DNA-dependent RNA polymerase-like protein
MHTQNTAAVAAGILRPALLARLEHVIQKYAPGRRAALIAEEFVDLTASPRPPRRGRPAGTKDWMRAVERLEDSAIAEVILAACLRAWLRAGREPPSMLTVAKSIGGQLHVPKEKRGGVGRALLRFAELAGIVTPISKHWRAQRLELSDETLASLESLYQSLLQRMCEDGEGLLERPSARPPTVRHKWDQRVRPFRPRRGSVPERAARAIHRTEWQVDPWMRNVVAAVLAERAPLAFGAKGTASERRAMMHKYGSDLWALAQATHGRQGGYFPVRWDHRGRLHQVGGALTYTGGSDVARSMLQFATAKPVTDQGRPWLARHLINQWSGQEARETALGAELDWIDAHRDLIAFTAADPIKTRGWERADEPFRFVAACRAWTLAAEGQPIALPVAVDASTSVLQHMALLLLDANLGRLVNLWPGERQDFYSKVGEACGLSRSAVKKIAMTGFYGQSLKEAAESLAGESVERWRQARAIKKAATDIAPGAYALHEALRRVAGELTDLSEPIRWSTPSGWECVTDRRKRPKVERKAYLPDGGVVNYTERVIGDQLDGRRQRNALTANLVQSLDASLLHLALADLPEGLSLATAHDSFGTHADDVPVMLSALKSALSTMYASDDVLGGIWAGWTACGVTEPLPKRGTWDDRFLQGGYTFC